MNFLLHNLRWILDGLCVLFLLIFVWPILRRLYRYRLYRYRLYWYRLYLHLRYQALLPEEQRALRKNALLVILCVCVVAGLVALAQFAPEWELHRAGITIDPRSAPPTAEGVAKLEDEYRKTILQALAGIFVFVGLYYTHCRVRVSEQGHITERYTKAIEQLGAVKAYGKEQFGPNIEVRLGAVYALERLARDSPRDHWTIMEVLTAYVRENAPAPAEQEGVDQAPEHKRLATEIQAILTVLGRRQRDRKREHEGQRLDLRRADLREADLAGLHFEKADFSGTHLQRADLKEAHLVGAHIEGANLEKAHLEGAELRDAHLYGANLAGAHLNRAELDGADLEDAHLEGAELEGAHLEGANLEGANLERANLESARFNGCFGLTIEQFKDARGLWTAHFDVDFRKELVAAYRKKKAAEAEPVAQPVTASNATANADAPEAAQTSTASDPTADGALQAPDAPIPAP